MVGAVMGKNSTMKAILGIALGLAIFLLISGFDIASWINGMVAAILPWIFLLFVAIIALTVLYITEKFKGSGSRSRDYGDNYEGSYDEASDECGVSGCKRCHGSGGHEVDCNYCRGSGQVSNLNVFGSVKYNVYEHRMDPPERQCPKCNGSGRLYYRCQVCGR